MSQTLERPTDSPMEDLWPAGFIEPNLEPPLKLLQQQARIIGRKTQNLIVGRVLTEIEASGTASPNRFAYKFILVAPALNGFEQQILRVHHGVEMYPVDYMDDINSTQEQKISKWCETRDELAAALRETFNSDKTKTLLGALMSQSRVL